MKNKFNFDLKKIRIQSNEIKKHIKEKESEIENINREINELKKSQGKLWHSVNNYNRQRNLKILNKYKNQILSIQNNDGEIKGYFLIDYKIISKDKIRFYKILLDKDFIVKEHNEWDSINWYIPDLTNPTLKNFIYMNLRSTLDFKYSGFKLQSIKKTKEIRKYISMIKSVFGLKKS